MTAVDNMCYIIWVEECDSAGLRFSHAACSTTDRRPLSACEADILAAAVGVLQGSSESWKQITCTEEHHESIVLVSVVLFKDFG